MRIALLAPLPPEQTGIADYAEQLRVSLEAVGVEVVTPLAGCGNDPLCALERVRTFDWSGVALVHAELGGGRLAEFHALRALPGRGLMVTAPSRDPDHDFVSRYFAPWVGVEEDPVTGSNHCALVPFWAERFSRTQLRARQISARGGELVLELQGDRVWMSGQALTLWQGEWLLPPCP